VSNANRMELLQFFISGLLKNVDVKYKHNRAVISDVRARLGLRDRVEGRLEGS